MNQQPRVPGSVCVGVLLGVSWQSIQMIYVKYCIAVEHKQRRMYYL